MCKNLQHDTSLEKAVRLHRLPQSQFLSDPCRSHPEEAKTAAGGLLFGVRMAPYGFRACDECIINICGKLPTKCSSVKINSHLIATHITRLTCHVISNYL